MNKVTSSMSLDRDLKETGPCRRVTIVLACWAVSTSDGAWWFTTVCTLTLRRSDFMPCVPVTDEQYTGMLC